MSHRLAGRGRNTPMFLFDRCLPTHRRIFKFLLLGVALLATHSNGWSQGPDVSTSEKEEATQPESGGSTANASRESSASEAGEQDADSADPAQLRFSFSAAPWRSVLNWIAEEAGLALHVSEVPEGSFSYTDPNRYTPDEAIGRINLFLIPQGFTLVRSGQLLSVISLDDPRSVQQLEAMAELVNSEELVSRGDHDVVRCLFPLGQTEPQAAIQELSGINLMTEPTVLPQTNQLLVTDTAAKLRNVKTILEPLGDTDESEEVVRRFELEHLGVEQLLSVVRPHLGMQPDQMVGLGVSISADPDAQTLFVTGSEETVEMLDSLIALVDVPGSVEAKVGNSVLRSHTVSGENLQAVYDVLQTLLAGRSIRLSMERDTNSIVALGPPDVHDQIESTINELQAPSTEFEVINLTSVDPYFAISLLNQMFAEAVEEDDRRRRDSDKERVEAPKIDADPANMRLFVRGKPSQVEQVKRVIAKLDGSEQAATSGVRILPVPPGREAEQVLGTAKRFWQGQNDVIVYPSSSSGEPNVIERAVHPGAKDDRNAMKARGRLDSARLENDTSEFGTMPSSAAKKRGDATSLALVSKSNKSKSNNGEQQQEINGSQNPASPSDEPLIKTQVTPRGILIQSDDPSAVRRFEDHIRSITGTTQAAPSPPAVFYLKYVKAEDATRMLGDLLDGAVAVLDSSSTSLVNGSMPSTFGPEFFGSFVNSEEGLTTMTAGSATVVSDSRLNRLIVQGTRDDIAMIEDYLSIIDKDESITSIETYGRTRVIELLHADAEEVAEVVRGAFASHLAEDATRGQAGGARGRSARSDRDRDRDRRRDDDDRDRRSSGRRGGRGQDEASTNEPKLALAVHPTSNSLIVTAPDRLFEQVEQLAQQIDRQSEQTVEVFTPGNPEAYQIMLESVLLGESSSSSSNRRSRSSRSSRSSRRSR